MTMNGEAAGPDGLIKETTTQTFMADVVQESMKQPVLVDFWAEWCGPCKQLAPVIEKAVKAANGKVKLVKMDIDKYPQIAGQLGVQSIPAVFAFSKGQPVDGFMGALPESQIKAFIERLVGPVGPAETDLLLGDAEAALAEGDTLGASQLFAQVYELDPENVKAIAGLARTAVAVGELDQARATLGLTPKDKENDPAIAGARAALELAEQAASVGDLAGLLATVEREPMNHQARYDLALGLAGAGRRGEAVDHLLEIVRRDRKWNDDGARKQLVQFFEAWGPMDESTIGGRRRLSSILFS
jgi:putative thioredoxin